MVKIVGVKFLNSCKVYYFDPQGEEYKNGEGVIVDTARGTEYGVVQGGTKEVSESEIVQPLKPVTRRATKKEIEISHPIDFFSYPRMRYFRYLSKKMILIKFA